MNVRPIRTEKDYETALKQIEELMDIAQPGSPEEDMLDVLATLVEAYEAQECPIEPPDPISALEHYLDRQELKRKDLTPYIGNIGRVHEIMNRRRQLTLNMIRKLASVTGIPTATLGSVDISYLHTGAWHFPKCLAPRAPRQMSTRPSS